MFIYLYFDLEFNNCISFEHDDVIKWKHFPRYWSFVRGIHRSPVNSPHKGQWREALMVSLICAWTNGIINNRDSGDLRRHRAHYDANGMKMLHNLHWAHTPWWKQYYATFRQWLSIYFFQSGNPYVQLILNKRMYVLMTLTSNHTTWPWIQFQIISNVLIIPCQNMSNRSLELDIWFINTSLSAVLTLTVKNVWHWFPIDKCIHNPKKSPFWNF